ncbi:MAG: NACHT domain-containing protein [Nitrospirae bacterium]|nr:NACHT domain-containing protein [Nitrospirota bacterium]
MIVGNFVDFIEGHYTILIAIAIILLLVVVIRNNSIWLPKKDIMTSIRKMIRWILYISILLFIVLPSMNIPVVRKYIGDSTLQAMDTILKKIPYYDFIIDHKLVFFIIMLFVVPLLIYLARENKSEPIDDDIPGRDFKQKRDSFCDLLSVQLRTIDIETNWSDHFFTPIDAEVEVDHGIGKRKKIMELIKAVRQDKKTKVFLLIGDPGSGKSVALRQLCKELLQLKEVHKTGHIPIYINMREWALKESWSKTNPPTVDQLHEFVKQTLRDSGDYFAKEFTELYFERLFDAGYFFIVLDSFDEVPAVLDVDESSWLIDKLSEIIFTFLSGSHGSRGILSSRPHKMPTRKFQAKTKLEIRPFTETKIIENLKKSPYYTKTLEKTLFKDRRDLIPVSATQYQA